MRFLDLAAERRERAVREVASCGEAGNDGEPSARVSTSCAHSLFRNPTALFRNPKARASERPPALTAADRLAPAQSTTSDACMHAHDECRPCQSESAQSHSHVVTRTRCHLSYLMYVYVHLIDDR